MLRSCNSLIDICVHANKGEVIGGDNYPLKVTNNAVSIMNRYLLNVAELTVANNHPLQRFACDQTYPPTFVPNSTVKHIKCIILGIVDDGHFVRIFLV